MEAILVFASLVCMAAALMSLLVAVIGVLLMLIGSTGSWKRLALGAVVISLTAPLFLLFASADVVHNPRGTVLRALLAFVLAMVVAVSRAYFPTQTKQFWSRLSAWLG